MNWGECQATGQHCNLNWSDPTQAIPASAVCYQGSVPDYYIDVQEVSDIQAGLTFASTNGVPLVVKNTGHDYKGRSSAPGSLSLWTHHLQPDIVLTEDFTPDGCSESYGKAVTYGAGQQWEGLYEFGEANGVFLVGGADLTVGAAGGWVLGGGHSFLSPMFGIGTDNVFEMKAVLPNGTLITANRCQNPDMFFALRGGGGNAFGVVTEVTSRARDTREVQVSFLEQCPTQDADNPLKQVANVIFAASSIQAFNDFLSLATQHANQWASEGWGGGLFAGSGGRTVIAFQVYNMNLTLAEAQASMQPILDFVASGNNSAQTIDAELVTMPTIWQAYQTFLVPILESPGEGVALASRLIPSALFDTAAGQAEVATVLADIANDLTYPTSATQTDPLSVAYTAPLQILFSPPYNYQPTAPGESFSDSSVTPAWRKSTWHAIAIEDFATQSDAVTIDKSFTAVNAAGDKLRALAPDSGAYQNEADVFEPDPAATFWGQANYDRLVSIKKSIDPNNVLTCWDCIGWDSTDDRYKCYPTI